MRTGESLLMSVAEAAKLLDVSQESVYALVDSGKWIGSQRAGRKPIISRAAFERQYLDGIVTDMTQQRSPFLRTIKAAS